MERKAKSRTVFPRLNPIYLLPKRGGRGVPPLPPGEGRGEGAGHAAATAPTTKDPLSHLRPTPPRPEGEGRGEGPFRTASHLAFACLLFALGLAVLPGCATGGKGAKVPVPEAPAAKVAPAPVAPTPAGHTVERLAGEREGFVIMERADLDAAGRTEFEKGVALIKEGKYEKGAEALEKVIAQSPGLAAPRINAAVAYNALKKTEQAELHLKTALQLVPAHPAASNEYGLLLRKAGRFTEARSVYEASLASFPEYHPVERNLAILCHLYLKDLACAQKHYENYSKAQPKDKQVTLWLADLQGRTGHIAMHTGAEK